jgi:manganese/iron transport system permease protein
VFLVLKGWALMGDAMSHAVFPGVVLAYIIGILRHRRVYRRSVLRRRRPVFSTITAAQARYHYGDCLSGMFGAGLVLYVAIQSEVHLDHILFGDMLGISPAILGKRRRSRW